jgi:hypothetical protein
MRQDGAVTKKHKLSSRGQRRAAERAAVSFAKDRVKLAELSAGGSAERPIVVETASVIEGLARDTRCAVCEAELELKDHDAVTVESASLRRVRLICRECHTPRLLWYRIVPRAPN